MGCWYRSAAVGACLLGVLLTGCSRDPNVRKQKYLESGERYYDKGQYQEAEIQFQNAIQVDPQFDEAHFRMAQAAIKMQQWPVAVRELSNTIQANPDHNEARWEMAKLLISLGAFTEAKSQSDAWKQRQPTNPDAWLVEAMYESEFTKNMGAAHTAVAKALKLDPKHSEAYRIEGILDAKEQQWDSAESNLKKAVELAPKSGDDALVALGNYYQARGRYPEAEDMFRRAVQATPSDPGPRFSLARLLLVEHKMGEAEDFLRQSKKDFPENTVGYTMLGEFYGDTNQTDKALAEYASLYESHGQDPVVRKKYILLLVQSNRLDEARKLNDRILKAEPSDIDARIAKAEIEERSGKTADALETLQGVLKDDPNNAEAHFHLGLVQSELGNAGGAETEWRDAVRLQPSMVEAHRALAGAAIQKGDASMLAQEADQIISLDPAAPDGYLLRGVAEIDRKQYGAADEYLSRSIERESVNPAAYVQLGNLRMAQGQLADAQKAYQQALDQDPNSTDALGGVLNVDLVQKQPDKALSAAKAQLSKYPNNSGFHTMLGDLLKEQYKDAGGAEAEYKRAIELNKNNGPAFLKLGMLQDERGAPDAALQTYQEAARNNPKEVGFYLLAGGIYQRRSDWDNSKKMYQKVLSMAPDNPVASNDLAYVILEQGGNVDVAFQMAQTARRQLPDNPNSADTLGWAFYHKGVYTSAISLFREAVKKQPDNALYNYHLGKAYAASEQKALARQQLEKVTKLKGNPSDVEDLKRAIAEIKEKT